MCRSRQQHRRRPKQAVALPISQVMLFDRGVRHLDRTGEVENEERMDLTFHESDINDQFKSKTLPDSNAGHISTVGLSISQYQILVFWGVTSWGNRLDTARRKWCCSPTPTRKWRISCSPALMYLHRSGCPWV